MIIWPWQWKDFAWTIMLHLFAWAVVIKMADVGSEWLESPRWYVRFCGAIYLIAACIMAYNLLTGFWDEFAKWWKL